MATLSPLPNSFVPHDIEARAANREGWDGQRERIQTYFDHTARDAWERLTSDAPVSGIRERVRSGRNRMRATLLSWLPKDLRGRRILDAGCGTGALAVEAAWRGADVVAVDVAGGLIDIARDRAPRALHVNWLSGDMLSPDLGRFDHIVAMDSLIHYTPLDTVLALSALAERSPHIIFTFVPQTPLLRAMHVLGRCFPRNDRAPAIEPVRPRTLRQLMTHALPSRPIGRTERIASGFYTSQALEIVT